MSREDLYLQLEKCKLCSKEGIAAYLYLALCIRRKNKF